MTALDLFILLYQTNCCKSKTLALILCLRRLNSAMGQQLRQSSFGYA